MNILFLTLLDFSTIEENGIYSDLMREFVKNRHNVYIISPIEKRLKKITKLIENDSCKILKLRIGNIQKTNLIEKGITTLTLENKFKMAIKEYFSNIKFDLVIYSTPPITFSKAVKYVKVRDNAKTYLLLKDIFPQNVEYVSNSNMVEMIAEADERKIMMTKLFNSLLKLLNIKTVNKVFGDLVYDISISVYGFYYRISGFRESIFFSERGKKL